MGDIIRDLPLVVFMLAVAFFIAMAGVAVFASVHARRRAAIVRSMPTSPIGMAEDGYREFEGTIEAVPGKPLLAPLTRQPVVWYRARVEQVKEGSGSESSRWHTVSDETSAAPFLVRDSTGVAIVMPLGAEVTPTDKSRWYGDSKAPKDRNPPKLKPTESTTPMIDIAGTNTFRYYEERIYAGDPLLVHGEYASGRFASRDDSSGEDDDTGEHAGPGDEGLDEEDRILVRALEATNAKIQRGSGRQPFMMTTTSQAEHLKLTTLGSSAAIGVAAVPLAIAALLLWVRFG
jgi:hypothetical protein